MTTPLYIRSAYSLLESVIKIPELINEAKALGFNTLALVDHKNVNGAMSFYKQCLKANVKAIFGIDIDVRDDNLEYRLVLYASDDDGFQNLMRISSYLGTIDEIIDYDILKTYLNGLIVTIPSDSNIFSGEIEVRFAYLSEKYHDFYIGLVKQDYAYQQRRNQALKDIAKTYHIKTFAMNETYYLRPEDATSYKVLRAIKDKKLFNDPDLLDEPGHEFKNPILLSQLYAEEDLINTDYLASLCNVKMAYEHTSLPKYQCPNNASSKDYLIALAKFGLDRRLKGKVTPDYARRLEYELKIILKMHFEDYFLIVYDFILYAKKHQIYVGPGRGSAAGSLVSYSLGITDIDPLKYGLIFERFLNPERISMPDIDTDFPDNRRDEVIAYVRDKYGKDHVGHILTYGTMQAKQALRDVARVLEFDKVDAMCKAIPQDLKITLSRAYNESKYFRQRVDFDKASRRVFDLALKLEGLPRHTSTHAAGIVLSSKKLSDVVPIVKVEEDLYSSGYTMEHLEELGLIKMDFLGLRNLSIIDEIVQDINQYTPFDIRHINLDDQKTFEMISKAQTLGVFQLESSGMQNLLRKLRPHSFKDIAITIALFRPGPMENIPLYLSNRTHIETIHYLHPDLKPILEETCGIIVYQEQIMTIARKLAGFSYAKADILRKAMSKKKLEELSSLEKDFIDGCLKNGYDKQIASEIYELILKFANYGFNKSHSIAYARIAYELAYLKANFPLNFYKALLNGVIGSSVKTYEYVAECLKINQKILGPSINRSMGQYVIENNAIRMPLTIIKNVGSAAVLHIIEERMNHGPFTDYQEACLRLNGNKINKAVIESLINAGAFDEFRLSRASMLYNLADALKADPAMLRIDKSLNLVLTIIKDNEQAKLRNEYNVLGFYFSSNPLLEYKRQHNIETAALAELNYANGYVEGFGEIKNIREYTTKTGEKMCFLKVSDDTATMDLVVGPYIYRNLRETILESKDKYVFFSGDVRKEASCSVKRLEIK